MTDEDVTTWSLDCEVPGCDFRGEIPMTGDDPNGDYALSIVMEHDLTVHGD